MQMMQKSQAAAHSYIACRNVARRQLRPGAVGQKPFDRRSNGQ